jgi:hypothetical protein
VRLQLWRDRLRERNPVIHVADASEQRLQRLRIQNEGIAADFIAMGRIVDDDGGTPWPIHWRNTDSDRQMIFKGDARILNLALGVTDYTGKSDVRFFTATEPYRSGHGVSVEGQFLVSRDFFLSELPRNVANSNVITVEVSITANPCMELQPTSSLWSLIRGNDGALELKPADESLRR